jgi:molybdopterin/thiamine biosynthesis adenylyltransferase
MEPIVKQQTDLSHEEIRRYSRHLIMPEVGIEGQKRLKAASVLLIGTGGLGSPTALYLAAAGIGAHWLGGL